MERPSEWQRGCCALLPAHPHSVHRHSHAPGGRGAVVILLSLADMAPAAVDVPESVRRGTHFTSLLSHMSHFIFRQCLLAIMLYSQLQKAEAQQQCSVLQPCSNNGTCELNTGVCSCLIGYGGPKCESLLYPACRRELSSSFHVAPAMRCAHADVKHCQCYRECEQRPLMSDFQGAVPCFETALNFSAFPADGSEVTYWSHFNEPRQQVSREVVLKQFVEPEKCGGCNDGMCVRQPHDGSFACQCYLGYVGKNCEHVRPWACFNACSRQGICIRGQCACDLGYFGIDCSINLKNFTRDNDELHARLDDPDTGFSGSGQLTTNVSNSSQFTTHVHPGELRIYVYELPAWLNLEQIIDRGAGHMHMHHDIYNSYFIFLERLLHDWTVRTLDPTDADLFYVPSFGYGMGGNGGTPAQQVRRTLAYLQAHYPEHFLQYEGADHVVWAVNDMGVCPMPADLSHLIWIENFGLTHLNWDIAEKDDPDKCFNTLHGIVAPAFEGDPAQFHTEAYGVPYNQVADVPFPTHERKVFFYFSGGYRFGDKKYSQGVRQQVYALFRNASGFVVMEHDSRGAQISMRDATFCLCPAGSGWSHRLTYAMVSGCIPVIVMDSVVQPGQDVLPYNEFSVQLTRKQVPLLEKTLRSFSRERIAALQRSVAKYSSYFVWEVEDRTRFETNNTGGIDEKSAYGLILKSLYNKKALLHAMGGR